MSYKALQLRLRLEWITGGYRGLEALTQGHKGLQEVTGSYKG